MAATAPRLYSRLAVFSAPPYRGPRSDHFDGRRFRNEGETDHAGFVDLVRWGLDRDPGPWRRVNAPAGEPPPRRVGHGDLRITFVNHATVLVQLDGLNVLTDPVWSERVSPVRWAGPRRWRPPGIRFEDLPPIDVVVVSHNHYDHLDVPTLRRLSTAHRPRIVTGLGNVALLSREGIGGGVEIDWWEDVTIASGDRALRISGVPARHFSGRGAFDRDVTLWMGMWMQGSAGSVFFAGDTGYADHFARMRERLGEPRLALLPIGAFRPQWFMRPVHMTPDDAVRAHLDLGATASVPIHWGTFRLADDGQDEPVESLRAAIEASEDPAARRFVVLDHGLGWDVPGPDVRTGDAFAM